MNDLALNAYKKNNTSDKNNSKDNSQNKVNPALNIVNNTQNQAVRSFVPQHFTSQDLQNQNGTVKSVSKEIRRSSEPGKETLVHKAIFEKINTKLNQLEEEKKYNQKLAKEAEEQAKQAAATGTWFQKKSYTSQDVKDAADNLKNNRLIKVPEKTPEDSIYRRVAKFLVIIGLDEAAKIIPHLSEEQTEKIIPEIATIRKIEPEEKEAILKEFNGLIEKSRTDGGVETARTILTKAYGSEKAEALLEKSVKPVLEKPFEYLEAADADRIKLLLQSENIGVKAIVLSQLEPKKAASVINKMDVDDKKEVILRLAKMKSVSPEIIANIDKALHEKLLTQNTENSNNLDGRGVLAQILKRMDVSSEDKIIEALSETDPELGSDLRKRLFTEEDIIHCDNRFLQNKLSDMETTEIAVLIRGKSVPFREKILANVSKIRCDDILYEESVTGPLRKNDVEEVTSKFYAYLRRAWENGELRIEGRDDGEIYVN